MCKSSKFTLLELVIVIAVMVILIAMFIPYHDHGHERARRVNCAGNLKQIGLALLMYSGDNDGYFPIHHRNGGSNFEPLNTLKILNDGRVYGCLSAEVMMTTAAQSNYIYMGSGLKDDNKNARSISIAYDRSGNHPGNDWMNILFIDSRVIGRKPQGR